MQPQQPRGTSAFGGFQEPLGTLDQTNKAGVFQVRIKPIPTVDYLHTGESAFPHAPMIAQWFMHQVCLDARRGQPFNERLVWSAA